VTLVTVVFWVFAAWAVVSGLLCITRRSPIASALWLVSVMFALAGIYVLLNAQFVAAIQVVVYAGAVMVLFLFVIMLLNLDQSPRVNLRRPFWLLGAGVTVLLGAQLVALRGYSPERLAREFSTMPDAAAVPANLFPDLAGGEEAVARQGVVGVVAEPLFQGYLVPFEITSVLLLAAVIGAVVLAKKRL